MSDPVGERTNLVVRRRVKAFEAFGPYTWAEAEAIAAAIKATLPTEGAFGVEIVALRGPYTSEAK